MMPYSEDLGSTGLCESDSNKGGMDYQKGELWLSVL